MTFVLASDNRHKVEEFQRFFSGNGLDIRIIPMREAGFTGTIVEDADSFAGNAFLKADAVCRATGLPAIADDSGLQVDALNGEPGIYSARYSGEHGNDAANIEKLLYNLRDVPDEKRTARFACAVCAVKPNGEKLEEFGTAEGKILHEKRGSGTFGYDPVFLYEPMQKTFAEFEGPLKDSVSHRGNALRKIIAHTDFFKD